MSYQYKVIPFTSQISRSQTTSQVAKQCGGIIHQMENKGWEYYSTEMVTTSVAPNNGCFGLGATAGYTTAIQVLVFRQGGDFFADREQTMPYRQELSFEETPAPISEAATSPPMPQFDINDVENTVADITKGVLEVASTGKTQFNQSVLPFVKKNKQILVISLAILVGIFVTFKGIKYYQSRQNDELYTEGIVGRFPQATQRLLTNEDVSSLSKEDLRIMRNEIFARKGFIFEKRDMKEYFGQQDWYHPSIRAYQVVADMLTATERQNVEMIKQAENSYNQPVDNADSNPDGNHVALSEAVVNAYIQDIKTKYNTIFNASHYQKQRYTNRCGEMIFRYENGNLMHIKTSTCFSSTCVEEEYYFWDNELFFVFKKNVFVGTGSSTTVEYRFYLHKGQLIRCKENQNSIPCSQSELNDFLQNIEDLKRESEKWQF